MGEKKPTQDQSEIIRQAMQGQEKSTTTKTPTSKSSEGFGKGLEEMATKVSEQLYASLGKILNPIMWFITAKGFIDTIAAHPFYNADRLAESAETNLRRFGK